MFIQGSGLPVLLMMHCIVDKYGRSHLKAFTLDLPSQWPALERLCFGFNVPLCLPIEQSHKRCRKVRYRPICDSKFA